MKQCENCGKSVEHRLLVWRRNPATDEDELFEMCAECRDKFSESVRQPSSTVWFGCKTEGSFDILYPCHSKEDVERAKKVSVQRTSEMYFPKLVGPPVFVVVLYEKAQSLLSKTRISHSACLYLTSDLPGMEAPRYSEPGDQE